MRRIVFVIVTIVTLMSFSNQSPISIRSVHASDFFSLTNVVLEGTWEFTIQVTDSNVATGEGATGSVFFWGVINEVDLGYDYFIIGTEYNRYGGFGFTPSNSFGGFYSTMKIADNSGGTVYYISGNPINHTPLANYGTVSVGSGGGDVSFNIENNGYDTGTPAPSSPSTWAEFDWQHTFTKADQDSWSQKTGATAIKAPETSGIITHGIYGYVYLTYYVWNFWWGYTSGWYYVNWSQGGTNGPATGSSGGCSFHFADITASEPGGGTGTQTSSTNCPPPPPPPCGCGGGSIGYGSLVTMPDHTNVPVQNIHAGDKLLGYDTNTGRFGVSTVLSMKTVTTSNQLVIHTSAGTPFRVDANPRQTLWTMRDSDGTLQWLPVTQVRPEDRLFTPNGWVTVTSVEFAPAGRHTMFDITASMPYFADGYLDPIYKL